MVEGRPSFVLCACLVAGCTSDPTTVRLDISAAAGARVATLSMRVIAPHRTLDGISIPTDGSAPVLPGQLVLQLPDESADVQVSLSAVSPDGGKMEVGGAAHTVPHQQVTLSLQIPSEPGCGSPPPTGTVLYVAASAPPGDGSAALPLPTIGDALARLKDGDPTTILIAAGHYPESLHVAGPVLLRGGYYAAFACRDEQNHPSWIDSPGGPAVEVRGSDQGDVTLDGLSMIGNASAATNETALLIRGGSPTVGRCHIESHDLPLQPAHASAVMVMPDARAIITHSSLLSRFAQESITLYVCSASLDLSDSTVAALEGGGHSMGIEITDCTFTPPTPAWTQPRPIRIERSIITSHALDRSYGVAIVSNSGPFATTIVGSALYAHGLRSGALYIDGFKDETVAIRLSTLVADFENANSDPLWSAAILLNRDFKPVIDDSILVGPVAVYQANVFSVLARGNNLLFTTDLAHVVEHAPPMNDPTPVFHDLAYYKSLGDRAATWGDPLLAADHYHLNAGSPAIDHASSCDPEDHDLDGDPRPSPPGGLCDIGADER